MPTTTASVSQPAKLWGQETITLSPQYFNALRLNYAIQALQPVSGSVLEIGSGLGAFTQSLRRHRPDLRYTATDIDSKLIAIAKRRDRNNRYEVADAQKLPYRANTFNAAIGFDVIEHLPQPQAAVDHLYRVIRPGGLVHLAIPIEANPISIHGLFLRLGLKPKHVYAGHIQQFTHADCLALLTNAGFSDITTVFSGHYVYQLLDFAYFSILSLLRQNVGHTVEGYETSLKPGSRRQIIALTRASLATLCYAESIILKRMPGLIGHYTAYKRQ